MKGRGGGKVLWVGLLTLLILVNVDVSNISTHKFWVPTIVYLTLIMFVVNLPSKNFDETAKQ